jgi:hypothetical protein
VNVTAGLDEKIEIPLQLLSDKPDTIRTLNSQHPRKRTAQKKLPFHASATAFATSLLISMPGW